MRVRLSLRWFLSLSLLALGGLLVIGYSLLSAHYFIRGMDAIMSSNLERAAVAYLATGNKRNDDLPGELADYQVAERWDDLPGTVRTAFTRPPAVNGVLLKRDPSGWFERPDRIYFVMRLTLAGKTLYASHSASAETASRLVGRNIAQSLSTLLGISLVIVSILGLVVWLLYRQIAKPVAALVDWTRTLRPASLRQRPPEFDYPELDTLANLIRSSLLSVQDAMDREHRFLRHTSHELRTPISVLRSNVALLRRLPTDEVAAGDARFTAAINRIDRASLTMQHLTETLLWLRQDDAEPLPSRSVRLDRLVTELVDELGYLVQGKPVAIALSTSPFETALPEVAARIVIGNLVRNALQHTWNGEIQIEQRAERIAITNPLGESTNEMAGDKEASLGFGLGLQLTRRLCERLEWQLKIEQMGSHYLAVVTMGRTDTETAGGSARSSKQ